MCELTESLYDGLTCTAGRVYNVDDSFLSFLNSMLNPVFFSIYLDRQRELNLIGPRCFLDTQLILLPVKLLIIPCTCSCVYDLLLIIIFKKKC